MEAPRSSYRTIAYPSPEVLHKDRKSKFYGYAFPIRTEAEVKSILEDLRRQHPNANHVCFAWQLGVESVAYRASDDGEPNNSAGMPIYGQIQSFELTDVIVAVARIFGGTKLGVGGLISAYRETARLALEQSEIVTKFLTHDLQITFGYEEMDTVMRIIKKHQLDIVAQKLHLKGEIIVSVKKEDLKDILLIWEAYHTLDIKLLD